MNNPILKAPLDEEVIFDLDDLQPLLSANSSQLKEALSELELELALLLDACYRIK